MQIKKAAYEEVLSFERPFESTLSNIVLGAMRRNWRWFTVVQILHRIVSAGCHVPWLTSSRWYSLTRSQDNCILLAYIAVKES